MEIVTDRTERLYKALQKFIYHVDELTREEDPSGNGFHREYRELREISIRDRDVYEATHGKIPHNIRKNRYKDIVPYDYTRVTLTEIPGKPGSDYINANFILDAHQREGYIASQGPLPHTLEDFWRLIHEYKVKVVMMACREVEAGKKKCAQYWVEEGAEKGHFGEYQVACVGEEKLAEDCVERHLQLITADSIQEVYQYHYTGWPDHGIPDDIDVILAMIKRMRDIRCKDPDHAPVIVHCSAGCGRTGTICAIDYAWEILKSGELTEDFSLYEIVKTMRTQRQSMVQTPEQYDMAHEALKELFQKHIDIMNETEYVNIELKRDDDNTDGEEKIDVYAEARSDSKKLQLDAVDTLNRYMGTEDVSEVPKEEPLTIQPKKEEPKVLKVVENNAIEQKMEKEKLLQQNNEKVQKELPKTQKISQPKVENDQPKTQKISQQKVEKEPHITKKQKVEKENLSQQQNEQKDEKGSPSSKKSYENLFPENYENTTSFGNQSVTQRRSSFEKKQFLPTNDGPTFMASRPMSEPNAAVSSSTSKIPKTENTSNVSVADTRKVNVTQSKSSSPKLTGPVRTPPLQQKGPTVESRSQFVGQTEQPSKPIFVNNESVQPSGPIFVGKKESVQPSGPRFISSTPSQEKTEAQQNQPKFISRISVSSTSSDIVQGNVSQNLAKDRQGSFSRSQTFPNSENYELAAPITESPRKIVDSVYAVPDKDRKEPASSSPDNMYSAVSKVNNKSPAMAPPVDAAYESIAMTQSVKSKAGRQYEEVTLKPDGLYSTVGDIQNETEGPPVPKREYQEPEHSHDNSKIDKLKNKVANTLFNSKSSSESADTSTIPGFNQRLDKKVKGPRSMPWSKKTKL